MNVQLRPPLDHEWPICRMLLPQASVADPSREFLLCVRDNAPRVIAAASFYQNSEAVTHLCIHVIPPFRRRGVGRQMITYLAREGARSVTGTASGNHQPEAAPFCKALGFKRIETLTTVEAELAPMRDYFQGLCARKQSKIEIVPLSQIPAAQVAKLHADYVAQHTDPHLWRALLAGSTAHEGSLAARVDGELAGAILGALEGTTAVVHSRFAVPGPQRSWVNALLLANALEGAWMQGARRVRFTYGFDSRDTQKLARRLNARTIEVLTLFTLPKKSQQ